MNHSAGSGKTAKLIVGICAGLLALVLALVALWQFVLKDSALFSDSNITDGPGGQPSLDGPADPAPGKTPDSPQDPVNPTPDPKPQGSGYVNNPPAPGYDPGKTVTVTPPDTSDARVAQLKAQAAEYAKHYDYDEALALLNDYDHSELDALAAQYQKAKDELVLYTGKYYHVFFHSLIVDTDKAFDGDSDANGYNWYMTTVNEFNAMLPLFLENDFILVDITELCWYDENGGCHANPLYLPAGKKPLIISIDDVNYYDYLKGDGLAERLDVDENGRVVTIVNGKPTYDGDVMPILDTFVEQHPEFSYKGAKGIVATTGYQGAFGYRITDLELYSAAEGEWMLGKVKEVAQALRASGWQIANHSYTHNQYWNRKTITQTQLEYDTGRWLNEIMPYVGDTNIFISPFGVSFARNNFVFRYLVEHGFTIYCPVGSDMSTDISGDCMLNSRLNLDGITMIRYPDRVKRHFFDPALVLDPARPELK